jgi:transposase-like protein
LEEEWAVKCMKKDFFNCMNFYDFSTELWQSIRTTNILERAFREVRRRPPSMNDFFTNETNSDRIMYGISQRLNNNWRGKILKAISTS